MQRIRVRQPFDWPIRLTSRAVIAFSLGSIVVFLFSLHFTMHLISDRSTGAFHLTRSEVNKQSRAKLGIIPVNSKCVCAGVGRGGGLYWVVDENGKL